MSVVIAIKDNDRIVFGSDTQVSTGWNKDNTTIKIWKLKDFPGAIMGSVGSCRAMQIVMNNNVVDWNSLMPGNKLDTAYVSNILAPAIVKLLSRNGIYCNSDEENGRKGDTCIPNDFLFAYGDSAWIICSDLSVFELKDYHAIGSGSDCAFGALYATKDKDPFSRIVLGIGAASKTTLFVNDEIKIITTRDKPNDKRLINKAFEVDRGAHKK